MQGAVKITGQNIVVRAIGLLGNLVIARILVPRQFGMLALGLTITTVIGVVGSIGLGAALVRGRREPTGTDLGFIEGLQLLVAVAAMTVLGALIPLFGTTASVALVMTSALGIGAFAVPNSILLERALEYGPLALVGVLSAACQTAVSVALVIAGFGVFGVAVASPVSAIASIAVLVRIGPRGLVAPNLAFNAARHLLAEGSWFAFLDVVGLARDQGLNLVLAWLGGLSTLGEWALATRVLLIPYVLLTSLWQVSFPAMARMRDQREDSSTTVMRALGVTAMGLGFPLALLAGPTATVVTVLFGNQWAATEAVIPLCCLNYLIAGPVSVAGGGRLFAQGKARIVVMSAVAHTIVLLALTSALFGPLGLTAAGVGYVGAAIVEALVFVVALDLRPRDVVASQLASSVACVAAAVAGRAVGSVMANDIVGLVVAESAVTATYLMLLRLIDPAEFRRAADMLRSSWRRHRSDETRVLGAETRNEEAAPSLDAAGPVPG